MTAAVHRIEALPGQGRYAVSFRLGGGIAGGAEQSVVAEVHDDVLTVAAAGLPANRSADSAAHHALRRAVLALHESRAVEQATGTLVDVDGGWDVGLGNVVLADDGHPSCVAHGPMAPAGGDRWRCSECGALAGLT